jgi:hypothetical protein
MKSTHITSFLLAGLVLASAATLASAGQRTRNPGGDSGGSSGSSGGSSSGGSTGSVAVPRSGGSSPWGGGTVSSRPSEPTSSPSSGGRRPSRVSGGSGGGGSSSSTIPPYSRARNGAPVTGYGVERGSVATLPPIISGPIYWGPDDWYFYPWGYGGLALGYFWDPWMWSGYYGGWGGYPYADPYGGGGLGGGGYGGWDGTSGGTSTSQSQEPPNPLDPNLPTGGVRLKVEPRDAEVFVDGFLAGRVDDFDGARQKLNITRGVHRIELRAPGYETATFNVTIVVGETTTYKTELKRQ